MSVGLLHGRNEEELGWFRRRDFLLAAASWIAMGGFPAAHAQRRSNVVELRGDVLVNGKPLVAQQGIISGDRLQTGPGSQVIFVIGNSSFMVRQNSILTVERGTSLFMVSGLLLHAGAVASVWGPGSRRRIASPELSATFQAAGTYVEILSNRDDQSYFCNCYGVVELTAGLDKIKYESEQHEAFWAERSADNKVNLIPARTINHTDMELEYLANLVAQRTAWQAR